MSQALVQPDVPFALLAAAQLLAAGAFGGLAGATALQSFREATGRLRGLGVVAGALTVAIAEALTAAGLGDAASPGLGWVRAVGAVVLGLALLEPASWGGSRSASTPVAAVAPLAGGTGPGVLALAGFLAATAGGWSHSRMLAAGMALSGAAAVLSVGAGDSPAQASVVLVVRLLGAIAVVVHLSQVVQRSLESKVVGSILAAVVLTAVAATSVVGTTISDRLGSQQGDRVRQAALAELNDLEQAGRTAQIFTKVLAGASGTSKSRGDFALLLGALCTGGQTFAAEVSAAGKVSYYPGSACGKAPDRLALDDLGRQGPVRAALAAGGTDTSGFAVLEGAKPLTALLTVGRPVTNGRPAPAVQVYGIVLDPTVLAARKAADGFDLSVITLDGRLAATTLGGADARALLGDPRTVAARRSPPTELSAHVAVSKGKEQSVGFVTLADGPTPSVLLALSAPASQVQGVQRAVLRVLVIAVVAIAALVTLLGQLLAARILAPIRRLTDAVERVGAGDLSAGAGLASQAGLDEVGVLSRSFDTMTVSLSKADEDLRAAAAQEQSVRLRLETVLASMTDGLIVADVTGAITSVNPAAQQLVGVDAVGQPLVQVLRNAEPGGAPLAGPRTRAGEGTLVAPNGALVAVACATAPLADRTGVVVVLRDLTSEREVERMKTEFLSNISHELRTPLTPIQGYAEILQRHPNLGPDKVGKYAKATYDSARRLARVIDLLVDVASLDAGRIVADPEELDLRDFLDHRLVAWRQRAPERAADLRRRVEAGLPTARVDVEWLGKAVDELIDNALKFSTVGSAVVLGAGVDEPTGLLRLSVKDVGVGLSDEARAALFSDFAQGDGSATRTSEGLGLGLAFVRRVADVVGVRLVVDDGAGRGKAGAGASFSLLVPRATPVPRQRRVGPRSHVRAKRP